LPCSEQDLSRLGRDLRRTVLVDDTPLAFLRQPDNGIPIFNFRRAPQACLSLAWVPFRCMWAHLQQCSKLYSSAKQ
jgi:hypothetical protein